MNRFDTFRGTAVADLRSPREGRAKRKVVLAGHEVF